MNVNYDDRLAIENRKKKIIEICHIKIASLARSFANCQLKESEKKTMKKIKLKKEGERES